MCRPHHACTGGHRAGPHLIHTEDLEGSGCAHHIDDGVVPPDFVEVDLFDRSTVQSGLDLGQCCERGQGPGCHPLGQPRLFHQAHDVGVSADHHMILDADDSPSGSYPAAQHRLDLQAPAVERQPLQ